VPDQVRTRAVSVAQVRAYVRKAEEYLAAATDELEAGRPIAATSLAIHAAINAADAVTGRRIGRRAAGQDHDQVLSLLATQATTAPRSHGTSASAAEDEG
jgi:hypothetical protein